MSIAADSNTGTASTAGTASTTGAAAEASLPAEAPQAQLEHALAATVSDTARIGELLDALRDAWLWLPLPDDGTPPVTGTAVTLPTVTYLGSYFVPAYSSARLLRELGSARPARHPEDSPSAARARPSGAAPSAGHAQSPDQLPHAVVRAADLARLLPPTVGIALNAGSSRSVPVYPQAVSYLAARGPAGRTGDEAAGSVTVGPLPVRPDALLAVVAAGLLGIPAVQSAVAAWLSVPSAGEGLLVAVSLDEGATDRDRDEAAAAVERAAWEVEPGQAGFPIDVLFRDPAAGDGLDERIAAVGTPFYRRQ